MFGVPQSLGSSCPGLLVRPRSRRPRRDVGDGRPPTAEPLERRVLLSAGGDAGAEAVVAISAPFDPSLLNGVLAAPLALAEPLAGAAGPPQPLGQTFLLHSAPGATKTIYLDFDGHTTTGTQWNTQYRGGASLVTPAYSFEGDSSFSDAELERIQYIWQRVSEDYLPFDVDVTSEDPGAANLMNSGPLDERWGIRVCIGGSSDWFGQAAAGASYVGSFTWDTDTPNFVFPAQLGNGSEKYTAEAISHEVGHTLGLSHDGTNKVEYYEGQHTGPTGWAPIMGAGYYEPLVQWSKGEYPFANQHEDDLAKIVSLNGFGYRSDDHGNTSGQATILGALGATPVAAEGIIERNTDVDYFAFTTPGGVLTLNVEPLGRSPNLNVLAALYDADGATVIAVSDVVGSLGAGFNLTLPSGTYYLSVDGTGEAASGFTGYGSLGYYSLTATVAVAGDDVVQCINDYADAEGVFYGTLVAGDMSATRLSDNVYEHLQEQKSSSSGPKYSLLDYWWELPVTGGANVTFFVEAFHSANVEGDDFKFRYSVDGGDTWINLLTVTKTSDDNTLQQALLPSDLQGTVYICVSDTDRTPGLKDLDSIYIDRMFVRSAPSIPGDANCDGTVDAADYLALKGGLGTAGGAAWTQGDFDGDGDVDRLDLLTLEAGFGHSVAPQALAAPAAAPPGASQAVQAGAIALPAAPASPAMAKPAERAAADGLASFQGLLALLPHGLGPRLGWGLPGTWK